MLRAYFGHHKCASRWIALVLGDACAVAGLCHAIVDRADQFGERSIGTWADHQGVDVLSYVNADWELVEGICSMRAVHVIRDPRDVCVSAYYSHRFSHELMPQWPQLAVIRAELSEMSLDAGLMFEIRSLRWVFDAMRRWNYNDPRIVEARYEEMVEDPASFVRSLLLQLEIDASPDEVAQLVERHRFESHSGGRRRGEIDDSSHYRAGVAGQWRVAFGAAHHDEFDRLYPGLLRTLGYR